MLFTASESHAQEYEVRFYFGANYYQGDLSPLGGRFSFSPGRIAWATMAGIRLNKVFKLNVKYMTGQLGGNDQDARQSSRLYRNLSFDSPLHEIGLNTEININYFIPSFNKYGIRVYYTTGINAFKFNPKTIKRNEFGESELIDLQPLGTEGQGLPGYDDKYSLTQINIPFGVGIKFHLFDNLEMGIEVVPRITFTDYLDDVSGEYVPYQELMDADRPIAAMLANRTGEYYGTTPEMTAPGAYRGNPDNNDWYMFTGVYLSYNFGAGYTPIKFQQLNKEGEDSEILEETKGEEQN